LFFNIVTTLNFLSLWVGNWVQLVSQRRIKNQHVLINYYMTLRNF